MGVSPALPILHMGHRWAHFIPNDTGGAAELGAWYSHLSNGRDVAQTGQVTVPGRIGESWGGDGSQVWLTCALLPWAALLVALL